MWIEFWNSFVKLTGWPVQKLCFRTRIYYENPKVQKRRIHGPAVVICNHTSVFDYAVLLFVFFTRTVRYQMAEVLFRKPGLGWLLKCLGGIRVDRYANDFSFLVRTEEILRRGGAVGIFPESRIPLPRESRPLEFKTSAAYLALRAGVPVIPVYTNGVYFRKQRARVMIGTPMHLTDYLDDSLTEKENLLLLSSLLRQRVMELEKKLNEEVSKTAGLPAV